MVEGVPYALFFPNHFWLPFSAKINSEFRNNTRWYFGGVFSAAVADNNRKRRGPLFFCMD
jgi:hypothetical protein